MTEEELIASVTIAKNMGVKFGKFYLRGQLKITWRVSAEVRDLHKMWRSSGACTTMEEAVTRALMHLDVIPFPKWEASRRTVR